MHAEEGLIRTPDHRLRVFVSSTLGELATERAAVRASVEHLRLSPVMFEMGARPHPPRALYRSYLAQSDVFVGIYWQRYGWVAPDMSISGLEDEFELAAGMPRLMYVKRPAPDMEPRLKEMLHALQAGDAVSYKSFATAEELGRLVLDDLALMLAERFVPTPAPAPVRGPATPPLPTTSLVGRDREIADVTAQLRSGRRLVTITGVGGVGKTRVAVAVLDELRRSATVNTAFIDLSGVTDPGRVPAVIAIGCGVREEGREEVRDALVRRLAEGPWLITLDNFEQVLAAAPELTGLLERCPRLQLLVTSRVRLRLRSENEYPVGPLTIGDGNTGGTVAGPALQLLEDRARAVRPDFTVDDRNRGVIADLCRRLDGLPLALELAAPQLRLFTPEQLLSGLDEWLTGQSASAYTDLPARQQTMRATVAWSWQFLDQPARRLFARLAVFARQFTFDSAKEVCGWDGLDVVSALGLLIDHSLVSATARPDGQPAFQMLRTVSAQARARLAESGEEEACFAALERYLIMVYEDAAPRLHSAGQAQVARALDSHLGDLSATLGWLFTRGRPVAPLITAVASCWVWGQLRGRIRLLPDISERLIEMSSGDEDRDRAALCWLQTGQLLIACRYTEVADFLRYWLPETRLLGDQLYGMALMIFGISVADRPGHPVQRARELLDEAGTIFRDTAYRGGLGYAVSHLGDALLLAGEPDEARLAYGEALQISHQLGDVNLNADAEYRLAILACRDGHGADAVEHLRIAARYYQELVHLDGVARCLSVAAAISALDGDQVRGAELLGAAEGVRSPVELQPWPMVALMEAGWSAQLREHLGEAAFAEAYRRGRQRNGQQELAGWLKSPVQV